MAFRVGQNFHFVLCGRDVDLKPCRKPIIPLRPPFHFRFGSVISSVWRGVPLPSSADRRPSIARMTSTSSCSASAVSGGGTGRHGLTEGAGTMALEPGTPPSSSWNQWTRGAPALPRHTSQTVEPVGDIRKNRKGRAISLKVHRPFGIGALNRRGGLAIAPAVEIGTGHRHRRRRGVEKSREIRASLALRCHLFVGGDDANT
jgi:hypothetical protein